MKKWIMVICIALITGLLGGCMKGEAKAEPEIVKLFNRQVDSINERSVDGYMNTLDVETESANATKAAFEELFKQSPNVKVELKGYENVTYPKKDVAKVDVTMVFYGEGYGEKELVQRHTLTKKKGYWLVESTETLNSTEQQ